MLLDARTKRTVPCDQAPLSAMRDTVEEGEHGARNVSTIEVDPVGRDVLGSQEEGEILVVVNDEKMEANIGECFE